MRLLFLLEIDIHRTRTNNVDVGLRCRGYSDRAVRLCVYVCLSVMVFIVRASLGPVDKFPTLCSRQLYQKPTRKSRKLRYPSLYPRAHYTHKRIHLGVTHSHITLYCGIVPSYRMLPSSSAAAATPPLPAPAKTQSKAFLCDRFATH